MKILFYLLGFLSAAFGLLAIFRAVETALGGGRLSLGMLVFGAAGIFISSIWFRRARALK